MYFPVTVSLASIGDTQVMLPATVFPLACYWAARISCRPEVSSVDEFGLAEAAVTRN